MTSTQRNAVIVALLSGFVAPFMTSSLNLSMTSISDWYQCGATTTTLIVNAYTLATAIFSLPLGRLADIRGRRTMIMIGSAGFALFCFGSMVSISPAMLIAMRWLMGLAAGCFIGAAIPMMLSYFPPEMQGRYVGIGIGAVSVGIAAGPTAGGIINSLFGWQAIFVPSIIVCIAIFLVCLKGLNPDVLPEHRIAVDVKGSVLLVVSLVVLMVGLETWLDVPPLRVLVAAGVILIAIFARVELKTDNPTINVRLFSTTPIYSLQNLALIFFNAANYSVIYIMAVYMQNVYGFSSALAGVIMLSQPLLQVIFSPIAGRLCERYNSITLSIFGMAMTCAGVLTLSLARVDLPLWVIILGLVLVGLGSAFFGSPSINAVLSCVGPDRKSEANAMTSCMRGIGQSLGLIVTSFLFTITIGNTVFSHTDPVSLSNSVSVIMAAGGLISGIGILVTLASRIIDWRRSK